MANGDLNATLQNTQVSLTGYRGYTENVTMRAEVGDPCTVNWAAEFFLAATAGHDTQTFYNPQAEVTGQYQAAGPVQPAYVVPLTDQANASLTHDLGAVVAQWLVARATDTPQSLLHLAAEELLAAAADLLDKAAIAEALNDQLNASAEVRQILSTQIVDQIAVDLLPESTFVVAVEDTLQGEAGDSVQALGHYLAEVRDMAGAWVVFKLNDGVVQGWVMNLEQGQPLSQYENFQFNSFAAIGGRYFAASDEGLYTVGDSDTDDGASIDAHITTMMLDFDSAAQKRVVSAYLGYTSSGTIVLKVRSVDDGKLVEHWYEAATVTADAPRAGYKPLGRGLRSRYWQFELANVDGADFEVDKLELHPIELKRRV